MPWLNRVLGYDSPKLARPVKMMAGLAMQKSGLFGNVMIRRDGYLLPFFPSSNVALTYWVVPEFVDPTEEFVRSMLRPGDVFVDVGANVGAITALAACVVGRSGRVVAIEPHPETFANLQRTVAANALENVVCLGLACGAAVGVAGLTDERRKDDNNRIEESGSGISVQVTTLAEVLREQSLEKVSLLKIDVEGYEGSVLRGLAGELPRIEALLVEVIEANLQKYGTNTTEIISLLQGSGFACFGIADDPTNMVALSTAAQLATSGGGLVSVPGNPTLD